MNSMPMIVRCTLGQGGGPAYLRQVGALHDFEDLVERSVLAAWALNLRPVVKDLSEPTRETQ